MTFADLAQAIDNDALKDIILDRIRGAGHIPFVEFMEIALYHPSQGYYLACDPARDYQSSPNVHPIFGAVAASGLADLWRSLDRPARFDVLECGAGNGRLAAGILGWLARAEPDFYEAISYAVQDLVFDRPDAAERLERAGVPLDRVSVRRDLPSEPQIEGCILSNELLDALPFHRVQVHRERLLQVNVEAQGRALFDAPVEPSAEVSAHFNALGLAPADGCMAEVNLRAPAWMASAASALRRGYVLTFDYGYEASKLYAPWRKRGTMLTFYRHTSGDDPYLRVGRQDITASVDFTSVIRAAESAGLRTLGFTTQADLLLGLGIGEALAKPDPANMEGHFALRRAVVELTDSSGLGRIRVLLQGKGVAGEAPMAFRAPRRADG